VWLAAALLVSTAALADDNATQNGILSSSIATSLPADGDSTGVRKWLAERGISLGLIYTGEALRNLSGGVRRGGLYEGKLEGFVAADLERLAGLSGLSFFANAFQIHHTAGLRDQHFESLITISNIEAVPSTRLSELWLEQKLFDDRFSIRAGQLAADTEFFVSDYSKTLISSDWPTIAGANLPSGGPAYPLATPGMRLRFDPSPNWTALVGVFNGDPGGQATANRAGTNFRVNDPPLLMGELQYRYNQDKDARGLAGALRLGGWHHFGTFADMRFDAAGLSQASPFSSGNARLFRGSSGIYGIIDQQIYRPEGGDAASGIALFGRISGTPSDRNLVDFFLDAGIVLSGLLPGRPEDKLGASLICAHMSERARAFDRDVVDLTGVRQPLRDFELTIELSYQAQVKPGWTVQPVVEYIVHPGGHVPDPISPGSAVKSGALIGVRSAIAY
jgi:porin